MEGIDRLLQAIAEKRMVETQAGEGQQEKMQEVQEAVERISEKNRMPSGISESLAKYFLQYDIPVSEEKMDKLYQYVYQENQTRSKGYFQPLR